MKHSPFDAMISSLYVEISALAARRGDIGARCGVSGDCGVGITLPMCNSVTNHGDMGAFSRPELSQPWRHLSIVMM